MLAEGVPVSVIPQSLGHSGISIIADFDGVWTLRPLVYALYRRRMECGGSLVFAPQRARRIVHAAV